MDELNNPAVVTIVDMEVDGEGITGRVTAELPGYGVVQLTGPPELPGSQLQGKCWNIC